MSKNLSDQKLKNERFILADDGRMAIRHGRTMGK
jgi:hypothetical protein